MKKMFLWVMVIVCCGICLVGTACKINFKDGPDYKIQQSLIIGSNNHKDVYLNVIVYIQDYELDQMFETIKNEYISSNGEPDALSIELFNSHQDFENEESSGSIKYGR